MRAAVEAFEDRLKEVERREVKVVEATEEYAASLEKVERKEKEVSGLETTAEAEEGGESKEKEKPDSDDGGGRL